MEPLFDGDSGGEQAHGGSSMIVHRLSTRDEHRTVYLARIPATPHAPQIFIILEIHDPTEIKFVEMSQLVGRCAALEGHPRSFSPQSASERSRAPAQIDAELRAAAT